MKHELEMKLDSGEAAKRWGKVFRRMAKASAHDATRPSLEHVAFSRLDDRLQLVSADGFTLTVLQSIEPILADAHVDLLSKPAYIRNNALLGLSFNMCQAKHPSKLIFSRDTDEPLDYLQVRWVDFRFSAAAESHTDGLNFPTGWRSVISKHPGDSLALVKPQYFADTATLSDVVFTNRTQAMIRFSSWAKGESAEGVLLGPVASIRADMKGPFWEAMMLITPMHSPGGGVAIDILEAADD